MSDFAFISTRHNISKIIPMIISNGQRIAIAYFQHVNLEELILYVQVMSMLQELLILLEKLSCSSFFLNKSVPFFQLCCTQNIFPHLLKSVLDNFKNDNIWFEKVVKVFC